MPTPFFLSYLELDTRASERDIKRAYARKLKSFDAQLDAEQFDTLRQAYQQALGWADMVVNNPDLAKMIWGGEELESDGLKTESTTDTGDEIASVDTVELTSENHVTIESAPVVKTPQLETVVSGFDLPAEVTWSAAAEFDNLLAGLNVAVDPLSRAPIPDGYDNFIVALKSTVLRLSEAEGGLEKSEAFEFECLQSVAYEKFKEQYHFIKTNKLMPILETQFGWDEDALSNRARELDGWAAQRFYALKHEFHFVMHLERYVPESQKYWPLLKAKKIPIGIEKIRWNYFKNNANHLNKIEILLNAFDSHVTDREKYINAEIYSFWKNKIEKQSSLFNNRYFLYLLNNKVNCITILILGVLIFGVIGRFMGFVSDKMLMDAYSYGFSFLIISFFIWLLYSLTIIIYYNTTNSRLFIKYIFPSLKKLSRAFRFSNPNYRRNTVRLVVLLTTLFFLFIAYNK